MILYIFFLQHSLQEIWTLYAILVFLVRRFVLTKESGYIYNPNYPRKYQNNIDYMWTIRAAGRYRISLRFNFFDLQESVNCQNDFLAIYDGSNENYPLINRFCGSKSPSIIQSKRNVVSIRMKTNKDIVGGGFVISFKRILSVKSSTTAPTTTKPSTTLPAETPSIPTTSNNWIVLSYFNLYYINFFVWW